MTMSLIKDVKIVLGIIWGVVLSIPTVILLDASWLVTSIVLLSAMYSIVLCVIPTIKLQTVMAITVFSVLAGLIAIRIIR